jgi:hypothetical protein
LPVDEDLYSFNIFQYGRKRIMTQNGPKWSTDEAVDRGKQAVKLTQAYRTDMENRFKPGEIELLEKNLKDLELSGKPGQVQTLNVQKAQKKTKEDIATELQENVMSIRGMVKAVPDSSDKQQGFGIGTPANKNNLPQLVAAAGMIINCFNQNREWAMTEAGILEEDIEEIEAIRDQLTNADSTLSDKKVERKVKTADKNTLQRKVEELITKVSAIGITVFRKKNKALVPLFEALIPGSASSSSTAENETKPEPETATTGA